MREITVEESKAIQLDILLFFDKYCKENNLTYYLFAGTLLGAVRHKGFIPWDDDIDVTMPRNDYNKLMSIFKNEGRYKLFSMYNNKDYVYSFAKIVDSNTVLKEENIPDIEGYGLNIDIFPSDGLPADKTARRKHQRKILSARRKLGYLLTFDYAHGKEAGLKKVAHKLKKAFLEVRGWKYYLTQVDKLVQKYNIDSAKYATSLVSCDPHSYIESSVYKEKTMVTFENNLFPAPKNYDAYLTYLFGPDYMTPPPEDKRVAPHLTKAYFKD
jgi:lipopolysaccharide cholinephosphotransferase